MDSGIVTNYLIAIYSLVNRWVKLRYFVQDIWEKVAYSNFNSAVAGSISNTAVAMIKQTESEISVDFPGHESFETVMNTITRGDPEMA